MINYKKLTAALIAGMIVCFSVAGCSMPWDTQNSTEAETTQQSDISLDSLISSTDSDLTLKFADEDLNSTWNEKDCTKIKLEDNNCIAEGNGVTIDGSSVTITASGSYVISGTLSDGEVNINVADKETVHLILNGVNISSSSNAPFYVENAKKVLITLADQSTNTLTDTARSSSEAEDYSATLSSKSDLVFNGNGTLKINAGYRNGIKSSDDLKFVSGNYEINCKEDGIIGKDLLGVKDGTFHIQAGTDGLKSTYDTDTKKGNIILSGGTYTINSANDGIQAENILLIEAGKYDIKTGNGSKNVTKNSTDSKKGLKASNAIYIANGEITIDSEDDAIHTNGSIYYENGNATINAGDDGVHADKSLQINEGIIDIQYCYEGLEAEIITLNGGDISITSTDDGINAAAKNSSTSMNDNVTNNENPDKNIYNEGNIQNIENNIQNSNKQNNGFNKTNDNMNRVKGTGSSDLTINGGHLFINASGDGLDSNGTMTINGGEIIVCGPTSNNDTAIDFDTSCKLNGGTVMAFGSSGMLEKPSSATNGACIMAAFSTVSENTEFVLTDSDGKEVLAYTPVKAYASAIVYSSDITTGKTYTINCGSLSQAVSVDNAVTIYGSTEMGGSGVKGGFGSKGQRGDMSQTPPDQNGQNNHSSTDMNPGQTNNSF